MAPNGAALCCILHLSKINHLLNNIIKHSYKNSNIIYLICKILHYKQQLDEGAPYHKILASCNIFLIFLLLFS